MFYVRTFKAVAKPIERGQRNKTESKTSKYVRLFIADKNELRCAWCFDTLWVHIERLYEGELNAASVTYGPTTDIRSPPPPSGCLAELPALLSSVG